MTKTYFRDYIDEFDDLVRFCNEVGCPVCEDLTDNLNEAVDDDFPTAHSRWYWKDIRDKLNDIDSGWDWYRHEDTLEFIPVDDEFDAYKADVEEWCEENDVFDPEDDEEEEEEEEEEEAYPDEPTEDLSGLCEVPEEFCSLSEDAIAGFLNLRKQQEEFNAALRRARAVTEVQKRQKEAEEEQKRQEAVRAESAELSAIEILPLF